MHGLLHPNKLEIEFFFQFLKIQIIAYNYANFGIQPGYVSMMICTLKKFKIQNWPKFGRLFLGQDGPMHGNPASLFTGEVSLLRVKKNNDWR